MKKSLMVFACSISFLTIGCSHNMKAKDDKTDAASKAQRAAELKNQKTKGEVAFSCQVGKDMRTIRVDKSPKRCEVFYEKFGENSQVAWAQATPSLCGEVKNRIKTNIESKGFKCEPGLAKAKLEKLDTAKSQTKDLKQ